MPFNPLFWKHGSLLTRDKSPILPDIEHIVCAFLCMGWIATKVAWKGNIMLNLLSLSYSNNNKSVG